MVTEVDNEKFIGYTTPMLLDLLGRVHNTKLPIKNCLLPLFEAIVNSIDAIDEANTQKGKIDIFIERDTSQQTLEDQLHDTLEIQSFIITDNGIGFNKKNLESFSKSDSTLKRGKGGKGVGRFLWLKAFEIVEVTSIFQEEGKYKKRSFQFVLSKEGVEQQETTESSEKTTSTTIVLKNLKKEYQKKCPKTSQTICNKILEHCLTYFLSSNCPQITVHDDFEHESINELFINRISPSSKELHFNIKDQEFKMLVLKLHSGGDNHHQIHFCANSREVKTKNIFIAIPKLTDDKGSYVIQAYIYGQFLDDTVNAERTSFNIDQESDIDFPDSISMVDLLAETTKQIETLFAQELELIQRQRLTKLEKLSELNPQHRVLLKYYPEAVKDISSGLSDEGTEAELAKAYYKKKIELVENGQKFLENKILDFKEAPLYQERLRYFTEQLTDFSKAELASYVIQRKLILKIFEQALNKNEEGNYNYEETIHDIIFPRGMTSNDLKYESHNLWIIDERLSYHKYLASDKPLSSIPIADIDSRQKPDIVIFNSRVAFAEGEWPFSSVVIIEFKRPMLAGYSVTINPIEQVRNYIIDIQDNKRLMDTGRHIPTAKNIPFYAYVICDLTDSIRKIAKSAEDMKESPDGQGFFKYHDHLNAYIEVISYDKLLTDAKKRNRIFFEKLGILGM